MRYLLLFLLPILSFAQINDTINLNEVKVMDYSQYNQFRPKFKKVTRLTDHTSFGLKIFSTLHLPKIDKEIEILAIEILFESKIKNKNYCNEYYYFKPMILENKDAKNSLIDEKWFEVDKDYSGRYIFPVRIKLNPAEAKKWLIGFETAYDDPFCPESNGYFDLIEVKDKSNFYYGIDGELLKQDALHNYVINYLVYYK